MSVNKENRCENLSLINSKPATGLKIKAKCHNAEQCFVQSTEGLERSVRFGAEMPSQCLQARKTSILKNKRVRTFSDTDSVKNGFNQKKSLLSSTCSHFAQAQQSSESYSQNSAIETKYQRLLKDLRGPFTDDIFPPVDSSLAHSKISQRLMKEKAVSLGGQLCWVRLSDLFKGRNVRITTSSPCLIESGPMQSSSAMPNYAAIAFNALGRNKLLLYKMMESRDVTKQGIYCVKALQSHTFKWKNTIIDDFVPAIKSKTGIQPAFLKVKPNEANQIALWPFLLQKVLAKYYSCFEALLHIGNTIDFLQELTGIVMKPLIVEGGVPKLFSERRLSPDALWIGQDFQGVLHPIEPAETHSYYLDSTSEFNRRQVSDDQFYQVFRRVFYGQCHEFLYTGACSIKSNAKAERNFTMRMFSLNDSSKCQISVIQRDLRFVARTGKQSAHTWIRLMVVLRDTVGFRWVCGAYGKDKTVTVEENLGKGDYFVIVVPDSPLSQDLVLTACLNIPVEIVRPEYKQYPCILEDSCMDLAQRYGKLTQINKYLCSYSYVYRELGLVVQNIISERDNKPQKIVRSVAGLKEYPIRAINPEFKADQLCTSITPYGHYTVVLATVGGPQTQFLTLFDFGS